MALTFVHWLVHLQVRTWEMMRRLRCDVPFVACVLFGKMAQLSLQIGVIPENEIYSDEVLPPIFKCLGLLYQAWFQDTGPQVDDSLVNCSALVSVCKHAFVLEKASMQHAGNSFYVEAKDA